MKTTLLFTSAMLLGGLSAGTAQAAQPLLNPGTAVTLPGGSAKFDFMTFDPATGRVLASHPGAGTFVVYNTTTNAIHQMDSDGKVNGEAIDSVDGKIFAAGGNQKVIVYDIKTLQKTDEISLTGNADCITFVPATDTLYVDHDDGKEVWTVDATTDKVTGSIPIADAPEYLLYNPKANVLYQNIKPANEIQVIDPKTNTILATWPTAPVTSPHGLALDTKTNRLFDAGDGSVDVIDVKTGKVIQTVAIAPGYVDQIAFDPGTKRLYCASSVGELSVLQETKKGLKMLGMVTTPKGTHTLAIDPKTHTVWMATYDTQNSYLQPYLMP